MPGAYQRLRRVIEETCMRLKGACTQAGQLAAVGSSDIGVLKRRDQMLDSIVGGEDGVLRQVHGDGRPGCSSEGRLACATVVEILTMDADDVEPGMTREFWRAVRGGRIDNDDLPRRQTLGQDPGGEFSPVRGGVAGGYDDDYLLDEVGGEGHC